MPAVRINQNKKIINVPINHSGQEVKTMNNCTQTKTHILVAACFLLFTFVLSDIQPFDFILKCEYVGFVDGL